MIETIQPPTDNLYKFLAIGGLAFVFVAFVFLFRDQARLRERYLEATVELQAHQYDDGSGVPKDLELRRAYFRREAAQAELSGLLKFAGGFLGRAVWIALIISAGAFWLWSGFNAFSATTTP